MIDELTQMRQELIKLNNDSHRLSVPRDLTHFESNHVFDENETVKWNREEVERRNNEIDKIREKYKIDIHNLYELIDKKTYEYFVAISKNKLSIEDIKKIESILQDINYDEKWDEFTNWICDMESLIEMVIRLAPKVK